MTRPRITTIAVLVFLLRPPLAGADLDGDVAVAIDRGIDFLLRAHQAARPPKHGLGQVALETHALLVAGVPVRHAAMAKNFEEFRKTRSDHTYTLGCIASACDAALNQLEADESVITGRLGRSSSGGRGFKALLATAVDALVKSKSSDVGGWNYRPGGKRFDNSNTQFATLALGLGARRGISAPPEIWLSVAANFIDTQEGAGPEVPGRVEIDVSAGPATGAAGRGIPREVPPGGADVEVSARGWGYGPTPGVTWNMTCAGVSSLLLATENLEGRVPDAVHAKIEKATRDGFGWLIRNWSPAGAGKWKYYGVYSLEKVASLARARAFGGHDWYGAVAEHIVRAQRADGSWPGEDADMARIHTALALLVLNRASDAVVQSEARLVQVPLGSPKPTPGDDNWVPVPRLEREFHVPSFFRMVRLRPSPRLEKIIDALVEATPAEKRDLLLVHLKRAHAGVESRELKKGLAAKIAALAGE